MDCFCLGNEQNVVVDEYFFTFIGFEVDGGGLHDFLVVLEATVLILGSKEKCNLVEEGFLFVGFGAVFGVEAQFEGK